MASWNIKYVGPYFAEQFQNANIANYRQLKTYIRSHTKAQNKALFERVLKNKRNLECIAVKPNQNILRNNGYKIREINHYAWFYLVKQLRIDFPIGNRNRTKIPPQKVRKDKRNVTDRSCPIVRRSSRRRRTRRR